MAKIVLTKAHMRLQDSTDPNKLGTSRPLTLKSITLESAMDAVDVTNFSPDDSSRVFLDALRSWTANGEYHSDHIVAGMDTYLWGLIGKRIAIKLFPVKPVNNSTDSLAYTGDCIMSSFSPFSGTVGDAAMGSFTLQGASVLTRDEAVKDN